MKVVCGKFIQYDEMPANVLEKFKNALESVGFEFGVSNTGKYYILYPMEERCEEVPEVEE